jgi:hypothetical protein
VAGLAVRAPAAAAPADHLRDQPALPAAGASSLPGDDERIQACRSSKRGRASRCAWPPRGRRLALGQRRRGAAHRAAEETVLQGLRRAVPRALQQQDQRRHAAALAAGVQPAALGAHHRAPRRTRLGRRPGPARRARAARDEAVFRERSRHQAAQQGSTLAKLCATLMKLNVDPGHAIFDVQIKRLHEYKRQLLNALHIVAPVPRRQARPELDHAPAHVRVRREGGAGLPQREADHQAHHGVARSSTNDRRCDGLKSLRAQLPRVARRADHPRRRLSEQISTAGMEASGTGNMKLRHERRAHHRHARRRQHRDPRAVGADNFFLFGAPASSRPTARFVSTRRTSGASRRRR